MNQDEHSYAYASLLAWKQQKQTQWSNELSECFTKYIIHIGPGTN